MVNNHSITENFVHFVFVTKFRKDVCFDENMLRCMSDIAESLKCIVLEINHDQNHVHILVDLHPSLSVSNFACKVKSLSSSNFKFMCHWAI